MNNPVQSKNLVDAINLCIDTKLSQYNFISFAKIVKINNNYTIDAQPLSKNKIRNFVTNDTEYMGYPVISGIPYLFVTKPEVGDNCVLLHFDTNINNANNENSSTNSGIKYIKGSNKNHALDNCIALCGFKNIYDNLNPTEEDAEKVKEQRPQYNEHSNYFYQELHQSITPSELPWKIDLLANKILLVSVHAYAPYVDNTFVHICFYSNQWGYGNDTELFKWDFGQAGNVTFSIVRDTTQFDYYLILGFAQNSGYTTESITFDVNIYVLS